MKTILPTEPFVDYSKPWYHRGSWPARWITCPGARDNGAVVLAFKKPFQLDKTTSFLIHVSADERYELFLDGNRIGRGPERGDRGNWFYETYAVQLDTGPHLLAARTWWIGPDHGAPCAQISVRPAFVLAAEGLEPEILNTGVSAWETKKLGGYHWVQPPPHLGGVGVRTRICGAEFPWGFENGAGEGWRPAEEIAVAANGSMANNYPNIWLLRPAMLPAMLDREVPIGKVKVRCVQTVDSDDPALTPVRKTECMETEVQAWDRMLRGETACVIPSATRRRVIIDLQNYYTAYTGITVSGGKDARVQIHWAEALFENPNTEVKGNRDEIEGKFFQGMGDQFEPDGGSQRRFETLWWSAGRYLEILIVTGQEPLTVNRLVLRETHYPFELESRFESSDPRLADFIPIGFRALEMCSHETYMDCPYYEQLMYVGDTRLEMLTTFAVTGDDRLPRKAVWMFDVSRKISGLTQSSYPSRITHIIPPFSLWWVAMVHDYAMWRDNIAFVKDRMPGVRAVLDAFRRWLNADGLVEAPEGWNYVDWVPAWIWGVPPDGDRGISCIINWQCVLALNLAAELEEMIQEPELAARNRKLAKCMARAIAAVFWDEKRGLFADERRKQHFSEHAQCLALISGDLASARRKRVIGGLLHAPDLARTTIYFSHYLFEALRLAGRTDRLLQSMDLWFDLKKRGLHTTVERPEPSRSDCHAWGAHPLFHYFATILGIRPAAPGFATVRIEPQLGPLKWARGQLPHPKGNIAVDFRLDAECLKGWVQLPENVSGQLIYQGREHPLVPGRQEIQEEFDGGPIHV